MRLVRRSGTDPLALGLDQMILAAKSLARGIARLSAHDHANGGVDFALAQLHALFQATIQILQDRLGGLDLVSFAGDRDNIAASDQRRRNMLLDPGEIFVMTAEQQGAATIIFEGECAGGV
jgi:hypothetical protein